MLKVFGFAYSLKFNLLLVNNYWQKILYYMESNIKLKVFVITYSLKFNQGSSNLGKKKSASAQIIQKMKLGKKKKDWNVRQMDPKLSNCHLYFKKVLFSTNFHDDLVALDHWNRNFCRPLSHLIFCASTSSWMMDDSMLSGGCFKEAV